MPRQPTGPLSFDSIINAEAVTPDRYPNTINSLGQTELGMQLGLEIHQVDVGNETGNTCAVGWGYRHPIANIKVYDWDGSDPDTKSDKTAQIAVGTSSVGGSGAILVEVPDKFHSIAVTCGESSDANVTATKYWNGSAFAEFPVLADSVALAPASNTQVFMIEPKLPIAWVASSGKFLVSIEIDAAINISDVSVVRLVDYVDNVASGNALSKAMDPPMLFPKGCPLVPFVSEANANNWVQVDFSQQ